MDIIINQNIDNIPSDSIPLMTKKNWLLNGLSSLYEGLGPAPMADFLRQYDQLAPGQYIIAEPIAWRATHNDAMIIATATDLNLNDEQGRQLFQLLQPFFQEIHIEAYYQDDSTWLLKLSEEHPSLEAPAAVELVNHSLMPYLAPLDVFWQRLLTEVQMFLALAHFNQPFAVNGLWFYGGPTFEANPLKPVYTDDESLCACFPTQFKMFSAEISLNDDSILLLNNDFKIKTFPLHHYSVRWFWNNQAYRVDKKKWWRRLWSKYANQTT